MAKGDLTFGVDFKGDISEVSKQIKDIGRLTKQEVLDLNQALGGEVKKVLVIKTVTEGDGAKKQVAEYKEILTAVDAIANKQSQLDKIQQGSVTSLRQQVNQAKQARDQVARFEQSVGSLGGSLKTISPSWAAQNEQVKQLERSLQLAEASGFWQVAKANLNIGGLASFSNNLTQLTNGFQAASIIIGQVTSSINNLVNALGNIQAFKLSFEAIGQGAGGAGLALAESSRIALGLGVDLKTVRDGFQQLTPVITNSGGSIGDVSNIVEALSSRFAAFGISGDKARRVTNGIIQAFAKGKLMAEELTQQISEADPAFKTDFAKAVGVSTTELEKLVKAGEITTDILIDKLPGISKSGLLFGRLGVSAADAADSLRTSGTTVDQVRNQINTLNQLSLERFAKSIEPVLFGFIKLGAVFTDFIDRTSRLEGIQSLGGILGTIGSVLVGVVDGFLRLASTILVVVGAVAKIVDFLLQIPGVTELVGIAIAAKMIAPLLKLGSAFGQSGAAATGWGKAIQSVSTWTNFSNTLNNLGKSTGSLTDKMKQLKQENASLTSRATKARDALESVNQKIDAQDKLRANLRNQPGYGNLASQNTESRITKERTRLLNGSRKIQDSIARLDDTIAGNAARIDVLSNKQGIGAGAAERLGKAFDRTKQGAMAAADQIGPLGAALIFATVAMAAYENANSKANAIIEASAQRVTALKAAIEDAGGSTQGLEKGPTGLSLAWDQFSYDFKSAIDGVTLSSGTLQGNLDGLKTAFLDFNAITGIPKAAEYFGSLLVPATAQATLKTKELNLALNATSKSADNELGYINSLVIKLDELSKKDVKGKDLKIIAGLGQADTALASVDKEIQKLEATQAALNEEAKKYKPNTIQYVENRKQAQAVGVTLVGLKKQYDLTAAALDKFAASQGYLTSKQKETIPTTAKLDEDIKRYQDALKNGLNPEVNQAKWAEASSNLAKLQFQRDEITRKGAVISVSILEQGGIGGTLSALDRYLQELNNLKVTIPIGSSNVDQVISKINYVNALRDAGTKTNAQLEATLSNAYFDERAYRIKQEQTLRNAAYDERISALREPTPAERELAARKELELIQKAGGGDLEARAQLERLRNEREIAAITKKQQEENKATERELQSIAAQQKQLQDQARKDELQAARDILTARRESGPFFESAASNMLSVAESATKLKEAIRGLDGFTANVKIAGVPSRWTGGPAVAGQTYQVNELGQEGFLSASGRLSAINKPKNGLWKAPSTGTVIPAHIWSGLEVPTGGISTGMSPSATASGNNGLHKIIRAIQSSFAHQSNSNEAMHEMASVQARQALEIGKLSRAVNKLADKDHTVNVAVRNTGSTAYLEAMNRRM